MRLSSFFVSSVVLGTVLLSSIGSTSTVAQSCGWSGYDFSSLAGSDILSSGGLFSYYLRLCGTTGNSACTGVDPLSSACQVQTNVQPNKVYSVGNWNPPATWSYINPSQQSLGVQYQLTGSASSLCYATGPGTPYTTNILLNCPTNGPQAMQVSSPSGSCIQNFNVYTDIACSPSGSKSGLSGGWIFIILLLVLFPVYLVAGCVYKNVRQGATGMEMIPNIAFWKDLPGLIKDGCVFTYKKLRGLCGGGGAAEPSGNAYETM